MDTGYVLTRVKGMHSRLLDQKALSNLILKPDLDAIIAELGSTPYRREIEEASVRYSGILCIEEALRSNMVRTFRNILTLLEGEPSRRFVTLFLHKWDVQNLKTILRGKQIHASQEEIRDCIVPAGDLDEATVAEMLKQPDVRSVIDLLATWQNDFAVPLTERIEDYMEKRDLVLLEYALDRFYYSHVRAETGGKSYEEKIIRRLIGIEIDITNIKNVLMCVRDSVDPKDAEEILLEGGRDLGPEVLSGMLKSPGLEEAVTILGHSPYGFITAIQEENLGVGWISAVEKRLDRYLMEQWIRTFRGDPLSVIIVLGYLWSKYCEVINLRIIARCRNAGVSDEDLEKELLHV